MSTHDERFRVVVDGTVLIGLPATGTPGPAGPAGPPAPDADVYAAGMPLVNRLHAAGNAVMATGVLRLSYFTAVRDETIGAVAVITSSPAQAGATLVRFAVYDVAGDPLTGDGDLTLAAATTNDPGLLTATHTRYVVALATPLPVVGGRRYAFGALGVGWTTAPSLWGSPGSFAVYAVPPRLTAQVSGLSDLPDTVTATDLDRPAPAVPVDPQALATSNAYLFAELLP